jgi:hypothetical protein
MSITNENIFTVCGNTLMTPQDVKLAYQRVRTIEYIISLSIPRY